MIDDAAVTTTASSMMIGSFIGPNGMMPPVMTTTSGCIMPTTTSLNPSCVTEFGNKQGLETEAPECCPTIDASTGASIDFSNPNNQTLPLPNVDSHILHVDNDGSQRSRPSRGCRKTYTTAEHGEGSNDDDENDSDFDLSETKNLRSNSTGNRRGRRSRHHNRDEFGTTSHPSVLPIVSPTESQIHGHMNQHHHSPSTAPVSQMPYDYQFGFMSSNNGLAPSIDMIHQTEEAENLLIMIMTKVLGQLEPYGSMSTNQQTNSMNMNIDNIGRQSSTTLMTQQLKREPSSQQEGEDVEGRRGSGTTTSQYDIDSGTCGAITTTTGSSSIEGDDHPVLSPFLSADGTTQHPGQRRKLDLASLGHELDHKRR